MPRAGEAGDHGRPRRPDLDEVVAELRRLLVGIRHGSVTLIVQDGRVVQIDATQKLRLEAPGWADQRRGEAN